MFSLNIGFVILFSGCYSSMHQAQVTDGCSMALTLRPLHREFVYACGFAIPEWGASDIIASTAFRYGHAPPKKEEIGYSIGILVDWSVPSEVTRTNPDINHLFPLLVRGSCYLQFPKNSVLDAGIGTEFGMWPPLFPLITYAAMSRDLGARFTVYGEVRTAFPPATPRNKHALIVADDFLIVPTLGARYDISEDLSLTAEMSLFPKLVDCETVYRQVDGRIYYNEPEDMQCEYRSPLKVAPVIGAGIVYHLEGEKRTVPYLDKFVGCLGCLSLLMIFLIYTS